MLARTPKGALKSGAAMVEGPMDVAPIRVVLITLDRHLAAVVGRTAAKLAEETPGLRLVMHAATDWSDPAALERCLADIACGDVIICAMLFMEDQVRAVLPALEARRPHCDAMVGVLSAGEIVRLTRLGGLKMDGSDKGPLALIKRLRGKPGAGSGSRSAGAGQMAMLRRLPKILRFIPGAAQDLRAYFLTMQYFLSGSQDNVAAMVSFLVGRYADGPRRALRGRTEAPAPKEYPEVGLYHPRAAKRIVERIEDLPSLAGAVGTVGVLVLRSYVLAEDAAHYDGVISALEAKGLRVIPAFASGLDARGAIARYFVEDGVARVDAVVSLAGFSLVGGPAYNDAKAAEETLAALGVPYISAHPLEFQTLEAWGASETGLAPLESTIMVAIPELDGAITPMVFGGRSRGDGEPCSGCGRACRFPVMQAAAPMRACPERAEALAGRAARLVALRRTSRAERRLAVVLFDFPPNSGAVGTAAYLGVFASLFNTLKALAAAGWTVEVPESVEALRTRILEGNAARFGTEANVWRRIPVDDHVRRERRLAAIEAQWGPAPGRALTDGASLFVLGAEFGNVFVGLQPTFGYEGDPMRLLFEKSFAPTHAFSAFYRYLREDFGAHAVLHFGTHGALEFMPGKQAGLTADCWPDYLIGELPNFYLYAANNPSEGALARRRSGATLISYLTPPIAQAGLYRGLTDLKATIQRWRAAPPSAAEERASLEGLIGEQARALDLDDDLDGIVAKVFEMEQTLIPEGLHVVGETASPEARVELLAAMAKAGGGGEPSRAALEVLVAGGTAQAALACSGLALGPESLALMEDLARAERHLAKDSELGAIVHALDGGYVRPAPGGDLLRTPQVLPTGRNLHGFDPFQIPSAFALREGARQAQIILDRHLDETGRFPSSIAIVLWGSDNLKSEGAPIAQALTLLGARPRFDAYGRLCGAALIPLEELGRPRIDVLMTLSGIFRDLLGLQVRLLAEAAWLAATADEPTDMNFVRRHTLDHQREQGCDLETAALRVFSNADGAYGANVNQLIDSGSWTQEDELADAYQARKCFAYGRSGGAVRQGAMLQKILERVDLAYQNVESVELGVTTIDHYVDTLGGISRAVRRARGGFEAPIYIGDQTAGEPKVRTLSEQVALETRTRMLNPRWYEGLLNHGYEGVRQIEAQVTNTMGWSATTGQVAPWIYQQISETFVLDDAMRARLAALNPVACARMTKRLIEACDRNYWTPDDATLAALREASDDLDDRLEGVADAA
jgi:magnesium chelatase subunit H